MQTKYIVDTNKHGIRRERPAVGYKAVIKLNKKNKKKKKNDWYIYKKYQKHVRNVNSYANMHIYEYMSRSLIWDIQYLQKNKYQNL